MGILTSTYGLTYQLNEKANYESKIRDCEQKASDLSSTISALDGVQSDLPKDSPEAQALATRVKKLHALEAQLEQQKTKHQNKLQITEKEIQRNQQDFNDSVNRFYGQN